MFLISEVRQCTSWLSMVSRLMEGLEGDSSTPGNVGGTVAFFTSTSAGVFGSMWLSVTVIVSDTGTGSGSCLGSGFGSGKGCAFSGGKKKIKQSTLLVMLESKYTFQHRVL